MMQCIHHRLKDGPGICSPQRSRVLFGDQRIAGKHLVKPMGDCGLNGEIRHRHGRLVCFQECLLTDPPSDLTCKHGAPPDRGQRDVEFLAPRFEIHGVAPSDRRVRYPLSASARTIVCAADYGDSPCPNTTTSAWSRAS